MKKFVVELSITQTFTAQVVVEGDFKDKQDPTIDAAAKLAADNMDHDNWGYENTEFEINNVTPVLDNLSSFHHDLLNCGYSLDMIKKYSEEDAEAELDAIRGSL